MNIAIDIDDTLTDSFHYFQPYVAEFFGIDLQTLHKEQISYGNLPDKWRSRELEFCKTYYDRIVADTTFKPDAAEAVKALRAMGHKIFIITARTTLFYTDPYKTTREELEKGGIIYDKLICTFDKATACLQENISLLIDDMPHNCTAAMEQGIAALLFTSPANQNMEISVPRVSNWAEVLDYVTKR